MADLLAFIKQYGSLISTVITAFVGCVAWWLSKNFVRKDEFEKLEIKVDNLASSEEVKELNSSLHDMQKEIAVFTEKFSNIEKDYKRLTIGLDRIETYLRGGK